MLSSIALAADALIKGAIRNISGEIGRKLRYQYYSRRLGSCGKNVIIDEGVIIQGAKDIHLADNVWIDRYCILMAGKVDMPAEGSKVNTNAAYKHQVGELHIGSNVHITPYCLIQAHGGVSIGNDCGLGAGAKLYSLTNFPAYPANPERIVYYSWGGPMAQICAPIVLQDNVGVGLGSVVLPGITIEKNSFVAPYSVVMTPIKENSSISGNPARRVKDRFAVAGKAATEQAA